MRRIDQQRVVVDGLTILATHYESKLPTLVFTAIDTQGKVLTITDYAVANPGRGCATWSPYRTTTFTWLGGEDCGAPAVTATFSNGQSARLEFEEVDVGRACSIDAL